MLLIVTSYIGINIPGLLAFETACLCTLGQPWTPILFLLSKSWGSMHDYSLLNSLGISFPQSLICYPEHSDLKQWSHISSHRLGTMSSEKTQQDCLSLSQTSEGPGLKSSECSLFTHPVPVSWDSVQVVDENSCMWPFMWLSPKDKHPERARKLWALHHGLISHTTSLSTQTIRAFSSLPRLKGK